MFGKGNFCMVNRNLVLLVRNLTSAEISTALRPFYFSVHPDLFGQYPKERAVNETSLQQLSVVLQTLQTSKYLCPITLPFYVKHRKDAINSFQLIKVPLKGPDLGTAIVNILKACDLPTNHLQHYVKPDVVSEDRFRTENIRREGDEWVRMKYENEFDFTKINHNHPLYATFFMQRKMKEAKDSLRLKNWLELNFKNALKIYKSGHASKEEIQKLKEEMIEESNLKDIRWDCGWNSQHFRGCLLALKSLLNEHPRHLINLKDQILVFSYFTGISLDGHIMLFSGEVRHNWLDFIRNIRKHKSALGRVPYYEKSLSHVLRNIKIGRRKFMPETKVSEYELNLKQLTTAVSDYVGRNAYPKTWPPTLDHYEIVVESESGPMMVSPTGQFIVPSSIPGPLLINFITANLQEAQNRINHYQRDKIMEQKLHQRCVEELRLAALIKDDNITPKMMIECCQHILECKDELKSYTADLHINVSTYYSLLSDGVVCIPWNFVL